MANTKDFQQKIEELREGLEKRCLERDPTVTIRYCTADGQRQKYLGERVIGVFSEKLGTPNEYYAVWTDMGHVHFNRIYNYNEDVVAQGKVVEVNQ